MNENCLNCHRPLAEHSFNTRDVCNMFIGPDKERDYMAWLIEISEPSGPTYFQLKDDDDWTADHDAALHFGRRKDAEQVIQYFGWTRAKAVEHMWPKFTLQTPMTNFRRVTDAPSFPVPTSHLEKEQMKAKRKPT